MASVGAEKELRLTQVVEYVLFSKDGSSTARSAEELNLCWFVDAELEASARKAGLDPERTLMSFGPDEGLSGSSCFGRLWWRVSIPIKKMAVAGRRPSQYQWRRSTRSIIRNCS